MQGTVLSSAIVTPSGYGRGDRGTTSVPGRRVSPWVHNAVLCNNNHQQLRATGSLTTFISAMDILAASQDYADASLIIGSGHPSDLSSIIGNFSTKMVR
jgi:hypothetical protein